MATIKYKEGSTWKSLSLGGAIMTGATATTAGTKGEVPAPKAGEQGKFLKGDGTWGLINVNPPVDFTGVGPELLSAWAEDFKDYPQNYTQLLGKTLTVEYDSSVSTSRRADFRLVGFNNFKRTDNKQKASFTFLSEGYNILPGNLNFTGNETNTAYASTKQGERSYGAYLLFPDSEKNPYYIYCRDTFPTYLTPQWVNIIKNVEVLTPTTHGNVTYTGDDYNTLVPAITTLNLKFFPPSVKNLNLTFQTYPTVGNNATVDHPAAYDASEDPVLDYFVSKTDWPSAGTLRTNTYYIGSGSSYYTYYGFCNNTSTGTLSMSYKYYSRRYYTLASYDWGSMSFTPTILFCI